MPPRTTRPATRPAQRKPAQRKPAGTKRTKVSAHTRQTVHGTVNVRGHKRRFTPGAAHGFKLIRKGWRAGTKGKRGRAVVLGSLGLVELVLWLTMNGTAMLLAMAAALLAAIASLLSSYGPR